MREVAVEADGDAQPGYHIEDAADHDVNTAADHPDLLFCQADPPGDVRGRMIG
jgi:hypothetical protein